MDAINKVHYEVINTNSAIVYSMNSSSEIVEEVQKRAAMEQIDLYKQLKEQLLSEVEKYRSEGKDRLANIISESLSE